MEKESIAIALGYGSLYNHAADPNCRISTDYKINTSFLKHSRYTAGTEITVDYHTNLMKRFGLM
jgi:hypothetical protein